MRIVCENTITVNKIKYLPDDCVPFEAPINNMKYNGHFYQLPGQDICGYGHKITTQKMVKYKGKKYRVYATCFSNVSSHWIVVRGEGTLHLRS